MIFAREAARTVARHPKLATKQVSRSLEELSVLDNSSSSQALPGWSWDFSAIPIFAHGSRQGDGEKLPSTASVSDPGDAGEREAEALAQRLASEPAPRWSDTTGQTLSPETRSYFRARLGHDLSSVRIHRDEHAARAAHNLSARAFTVGNEVYFAQGQFNPDSRPGRRLLAHELAHVVQQSRGRARGHAIQRDPNPDEVPEPPAGVSAAADRPRRLEGMQKDLKDGNWKRAVKWLNGFDENDSLDGALDSVGAEGLRAILDEAKKLDYSPVLDRIAPLLASKEVKSGSPLAFAERVWMDKVALPILLTDTHKGASISLEHRILILAHARLESLSASKDASGSFTRPQGWNVFNFQVESADRKGKPGFEKVSGFEPGTRWEYKEQVQIKRSQLNETITIEKPGSPREKNIWKKYIPVEAAPKSAKGKEPPDEKKSGPGASPEAATPAAQSPSDTIMAKEFKKYAVQLPIYPDVGTATEEYLNYFKETGPYQQGFKALTSETPGDAGYYAALKNFGTGYTDPQVGNTPQAQIGKVVADLRPKLRTYAEEALNELGLRKGATRVSPRLAQLLRAEALLKQLAVLK
jgi:hypothetical protein